jgi:hypothetical protein
VRWYEKLNITKRLWLWGSWTAKKVAKSQGGHMEPALVRKLLPNGNVKVNFLYLHHQMSAANLPEGLGDNGMLLFCLFVNNFLNPSFPFLVDKAITPT